MFLQLNGTISVGDGVEFSFVVDGISVTPVIDRNDLSYVTRAFAAAGTYEVHYLTFSYHICMITAIKAFAPQYYLLGYLYSKIRYHQNLHFCDMTSFLSI